MKNEKEESMKATYVEGNVRKAAWKVVISWLPALSALKSYSIDDDMMITTIMVARKMQPRALMKLMIICMWYYEGGSNEEEWWW